MLQIIHQYHINMIFRILLACLCGVSIGFERKNRAKEAGMRTHCIVAAASALMMIISKYGFYDVVVANIKLDPSRMAAGIITGVGFLGAGIIYIQRGSIRGLTTAAGIWATAGIGMAAGAGMYIVGLASTGIILLAQVILHSSSSFMTLHKQKALKIYDVNEQGFQSYTVNKLNDIDISVTDVSARRNPDGNIDYVFFCDMPNRIEEEYLIKLFPYRSSIEEIR